jgi:hypothetical protein
VTWGLAPLPAEWALPARILVECALGCVLAVLWLRRLGLDVCAAALGGALFAATCLLGQSFWPPVVATLAWLPALLLCIETLARRWQPGAWLGLVAATALQLLAGFPQFALYSLQLAGCYALLRTATHHGVGRGPWRALGSMAAAVALGAGVAGAQLLPSLELVQHSSRAGTLDTGETHYLGDSAGAAAALRNALDPAPKLLAFDYQGGGNYLGTGTLLLLAVGAALGPPALVLPLLALGALALLLSDGHLGPGAPLFRVYSALPGVGWFRAPERIRIVTLVAAIAVACIGLDRVGRGRDGSSRRRMLAAAAALAVATLGIALVGAPGAAARALVAAAWIALALAMPHAPRVRYAAQALLVACILADLLLATAPFGSLRALPRDWSERFSLSGYAIADAAAIARLRGGADGARVEVEKALPATGGEALHGADHVNCLEPLAPRPWRQLLAELPLSERDTLYDVASVAHLVRPLRRDPEAGARLYAEFVERYVSGAPLAEGPPPGFTLRLVERPTALPRAYWVGRHALGTQDAALAHVARGDFDFHAAVWLEQDPGVASPGDAPPLRPARIVSATPESVEVELDAPAAGLLVLTDTWYPGWRAIRDGRELPILRANGLFRAVAVPAGPSRVRFEYAPASFRAGVALSIASLGIAIAWPLAALRYSRMPRA